MPATTNEERETAYQKRLDTAFGALRPRDQQAIGEVFSVFVELIDEQFATREELDALRAELGALKAARTCAACAEARPRLGVFGRVLGWLRARFRRRAGTRPRPVLTR